MTTIMNTRNSLESQTQTSRHPNESVNRFSVSIAPNKSKNDILQEQIFKKKVSQMQEIEQWKCNQLQSLGLLSLIHLLKEYSRKDVLYGRSLDLIEDAYSEIFSTRLGKAFNRELNKLPQNLKLKTLDFQVKYKKTFEYLMSLVDADFNSKFSKAVDMCKEILQFYLDKNKKRRKSFEDSMSNYSAISNPSHVKKVRQVSKQRPKQPEESSQYTLKGRGDSVSSFKMDRNQSVFSYEDEMGPKGTGSHPNNDDLSKMSFRKFNQLIVRTMQQNKSNNQDSFEDY